jgi:hypothetical protein
MRCIYCKVDTETSKSLQHIIPESLGCKKHVLKRGWVCDKCNNYIAIKIEKPVLDSHFLRNTRFIEGIPNKRGNIPYGTGIDPAAGTFFHISKPAGEATPTTPAPLDDPGWRPKQLILPCLSAHPLDFNLSRFIAKIAYEILAQRCAHIPGWNDEVLRIPELELIRKYIRYGEPKTIWPIAIRQLYRLDSYYILDGIKTQTLNEFDILVTKHQEYYAVIAILGTEYVINLGGPDLDGYALWLKTNNNQSFLYTKEPWIERNTPY